MNGVSTRTERLFNGVILLGILFAMVALALYGYLGTFSRYGSDDYCLSAFYYSDVDLLTRLVDRYQHSSSRYTNILFIGLVDSVFGWYNVSILPPLMIALFLLGWYLLFNDIVRMTSLGWSRAFSFLLASLLLFFSLLQAPNLYETLYWRAGMTSHFVPLALMPFLFVFLLRQINKTGKGIPAWWVCGACLFFAFMLGGFSEPPATLMVTILALTMLVVWWKRDLLNHRASLYILSWTLMGAMLALITLALAPANSIRLGNSAPGLFGLVSKTMRYPIEFIRDDLLAFPTPTLVLVLLPTMLFFLEYSKQLRSQSSLRTLRIIFWMILGTSLACLLIAASFAPSVYGQNFPIARARFAGRVILNGNLIFIGAMLGILLSNLRATIVQRSSLQLVALVALLLLSLYPLWTSQRVVQEIPLFQQRAEAWDERDALIRSMQADGVRDVIVTRLPTEVIQDFQDRARFRLNRCGSILYGVDSIIAIHVGK